MNINRSYVTAAITITVGLGALFYFWGIGRAAQTPETVYVDRSTGEAFLVRSQSPIENNPDTGEPTLTPGLYCEKCHAWKPIGPTENLQAKRMVPRCQIHKIPLSRDGPLPE